MGREESFEIGKICILGVNKTSHALLAEFFNPLFKCRTIAEVDVLVSRINDQLQAFEITKKPLNVLLELSSAKSKQNAPMVDLVLTIHEKNLIAKTGTEWRQNEVTMVSQ